MYFYFWGEKQQLLWVKSGHRYNVDILTNILGGPTKVKPTYIFVCKIWIKFEWIDKIQWFLVNVITVRSHTLGSIKI